MCVVSLADSLPFFILVHTRVVYSEPMQRVITVSGALQKQRQEKLKEIEIRLPDFKQALKKNTLLVSFYRVLVSPV